MVPRARSLSPAGQRQPRGVLRVRLRSVAVPPLQSARARGDCRCHSWHRGAARADAKWHRCGSGRRRGDSASRQRRDRSVDRSENVRLGSDVHDARSACVLAATAGATASLALVRVRCAGARQQRRRGRAAGAASGSRLRCAATPSVLRTGAVARAVPRVAGDLLLRALAGPWRVHHCGRNAFGVVAGRSGVVARGELVRSTRLLGRSPVDHDGGIPRARRRRAGDRSQHGIARRLGRPGDARADEPLLRASRLHERTSRVPRGSRAGRCVRRHARFGGRRCRRASRVRLGCNGRLDRRRRFDVAHVDRKLRRAGRVDPRSPRTHPRGGSARRARQAMRAVDVASVAPVAAAHVGPSRRAAVRIARLRARESRRDPVQGRDVAGIVRRRGACACPVRVGRRFLVVEPGSAQVRTARPAQVERRRTRACGRGRCVRKQRTVARSRIRRNRGRTRRASSRDRIVAARRLRWRMGIRDSRAEVRPACAQGRV